MLTDRGLVSALRAHLTKAVSSARLDVDATVARARFDPRVEAAVYFCILEALQNAAKHAAKAPVSVRISSEPMWLLFEVSDPGPGFDASIDHPGSGLQGMADRLAALGGVFEVRSAVGQGTSVYATRSRPPRPRRVA